MRDMIHNKQVVHLGNLALSGTTPATSAYVDLRGFDACTIVLVNNTVTDAGTASGFTATLQESANTTAAAAATVAAADAVDGVVTISETSDAAGDALTGSAGFGYVGSSRYVGVSVVGTALTAADVSVLAILNKPHRAETTFAGTKVART